MRPSSVLTGASQLCRAVAADVPFRTCIWHAMLNPLLVLQGFSLKTLKHLVLDEADRLLNMDFEQEIDQILKAIPKVCHCRLAAIHAACARLSV